ncbi:hypothetical protein C4D60_Mb03t18830 [Musa balbisiana]|uniref:Metallothionein-like protein n=1 Tax=Musa balbisiana TaxID=52838 RepID=A0A4S8JAY8_MUSBA|nr:hypothetical protein C4D60_Mb03t18830 [Musa balbisiana]
MSSCGCGCGSGCSCSCSCGGGCGSCKMFPDLGGERGTTAAGIIDLGILKVLRWQMGPREEAVTAASASAEAAAAVLAAAVTETCISINRIIRGVYADS